MKISLHNDHLKISLSMIEKIGAGRGSLIIHYDNIVPVFSESTSNLLGFKIIGTNIPQILEIGTYLVGTQKQFWYVKRRKNDYLILVLKSNFYSRIILEIENSKELIQQINDKLGLR